MCVYIHIHTHIHSFLNYSCKETRCCLYFIPMEFFKRILILLIVLIVYIESRLLVVNRKQSFSNVIINIYKRYFKWKNYKKIIVLIFSLNLQSLSYV